MHMTYGSKSLNYEFLSMLRTGHSALKKANGRTISFTALILTFRQQTFVLLVISSCNCLTIRYKLTFWEGKKAIIFKRKCPPVDAL